MQALQKMQKGPPAPTLSPNRRCLSQIAHVGTSYVVSKHTVVGKGQHGASSLCAFEQSFCNKDGSRDHSRCLPLPLAITCLCPKCQHARHTIATAPVAVGAQCGHKARQACEGELGLCTPSHDDTASAPSITISDYLNSSQCIWTHQIDAGDGICADTLCAKTYGNSRHTTNSQERLHIDAQDLQSKQGT